MEEKKLQALISLLDDEDSEVFGQIENEFIAFGEEIIPILEKEWENNFDPVVQRRIEEIIRQVQFDTLRDKLIIWHEGGGLDLLEGMWILSTFLYPDLEQEYLEGIIDDIHEEVRKGLKPGMLPYDHVKVLNSVMYNKFKFKANTKNFHSPSNSMINVVLETKKGNPLTLSSIYSLVAQKAGLPIFGVNLPNLFVLVYQNEEEPFYINPFNKGLVFTKSDIDNFLGQLNLPDDPIFYEPCLNVEIIKRSIRNLIVSFEKLGEPDKVEELKILIRLISEETGDIY